MISIVDKDTGQETLSVTAGRNRNYYKLTQNQSR